MAPFVVFEGIDGSGKSTQLGMLAERLRVLGLDPLELREPTSGEWGKKIRALSKRREPLPRQEELELFLRDRFWNVTENILPALKLGRPVLQDRYYHSTACYQAGSEREFQEIVDRNRSFAPEPDLTLIFLVDVGSALARIGDRGERRSYFETGDFLERVQERYLLFKGERGVVLIDSSRSREEIHREVLKHYAERI